MTFENWIRWVFDHPVSEPKWYWSASEEEVDDPEPSVCVEHLTGLFDAPEVLNAYSDAQADQGLWYLTSNCCSNYTAAIFRDEVAWPLRQGAIRAIATLFEKLYSVRCTDHLCHLDENGAGPLNTSCYMWWDHLPCGAPKNPACTEQDAEQLGVMERVLKLKSIACQESALHGLGHWKRDYPKVVERIIDDYLARSKFLREDLRYYAQCARTGYIQ